MGTSDRRTPSNEEMRATVFPSVGDRFALPHQTTEVPRAPVQVQSQEANMHNIHGSSTGGSCLQSSYTPQSVTSEWNATYDNIVTPNNLGISVPSAGVPRHAHLDSAAQIYDHRARYAGRIGQESADPSPRPGQQDFGRSPAKVVFAPAVDSLTPTHQKQVSELLQTRRANASPSREDMQFKPLPQSPHMRYSDLSSLDSAKYYEYMAPEPLHIPPKTSGTPHPQMTSPEHRVSDKHQFDWFKANNLPHPKRDEPRETVWFESQPPTRYITGRPGEPDLYVGNSPVMYRQVGNGPVQASVDGKPVYRSPRRKPYGDDREIGASILRQYENNRAGKEATYSTGHHKATSDISEYGSHPHQTAAHDNNYANKPGIIKSHSQKYYRHAPPEMADYDSVPDLEYTPGGHTRMIRKEDRSSGSTTSGPRGRSVVRNRRSRSLSPTKKSYDFGRGSEEDEYVFCDDSAPPKRSRSPMKQMFGEKGWLHRGNSMNQVATSPKKKGFKDFARLVMQKTDDKVSNCFPFT